MVEALWKLSLQGGFSNFVRLLEAADFSNIKKGKKLSVQYENQSFLAKAFKCLSEQDPITRYCTITCRLLKERNLQLILSRSPLHCKTLWSQINSEIFIFEGSALKPDQISDRICDLIYELICPQKNHTKKKKKYSTHKNFSSCYWPERVNFILLSSQHFWITTI